MEHGKSINRKRPFVVLALLAFLSVVPVSWALTIKTDIELREALLLQARIAGKAVDVPLLVRLKGTEEDLGSLIYHRFKEQLAAIHSASNTYRFVYLMGKHRDNTIFFYADSEAPSSKDYSPPGQVYDEATKAFRDVFVTNQGIVEGPTTDEWGTWVSAIVPVVDPRTGNVVAVLGIDVDASLWKFHIAEHVLPSLGFMLLMVSFIVGYFWFLLRKFKMM